jgi:cupin 2 domain-containing protein
MYQYDEAAVPISTSARLVKTRIVVNAGKRSERPLLIARGRLYAPAILKGSRKMTFPPKPDEASSLPDETFEPLLSRPGVLVERITSHGNITPADQPYCQERDEWVMVVSGTARLVMAGQEHTLNPGEHLLIPAGVQHWVTYTSTTEPTVWLAVHVPATDSGRDF